MKKSSNLVCFADSRRFQYAVRELASREDIQHKKKLIERDSLMTCKGSTAMGRINLYQFQFEY